MRADFLVIATWIVCACGKATPSELPVAATPQPSNGRETVTASVADANTEEPACGPSVSPATFLCDYEERCANRDTAGPIDIDSFLCAIMAAPLVGDMPQTMSEIVSRLPYRFRRNLTFKHGEQQSMLRGHAIETKELTTTATLEEPRVLMWDEDTGFTISFNGGPVADSPEDQRTERELHMMSIDEASAAFSFWSVDLPIVSNDGRWHVQPTQPTDSDVDCRRCHGAVSRPIWAMYPDWPGIFGSDTDELTKNNSHQSFEREALARFRSCVATGKREARCAQSGAVQGDRHHRYLALFDERTEEGLAEDFRRIDKAAIRSYLKARARGDAGRRPKYRLTSRATSVVAGGDEELRNWLGLTLHTTYPYRPNHELQKSEASRALFHRPNLRAGALYNRLNSRRVMALMRQSPVYEPFKKLIAFTLMDCGWRPSDTQARRAVLGALAVAASRELDDAAMVLPANNSDGKILYPALLATLGLSLRDVDIRFSRPNAHFDEFDSGYNTPTMAATAMDLGYIAYGARDNNQANGSMRYFNSYFDGSASFDELLVAQILEEFGEDYARLYDLNSFELKFRDVTSRYELDKSLFAKMDRLSKWFPLPYPKHLKPLHNRQAFLRKRGGAYPFRDQHTAVCTHLRDDIIAGVTTPE